MSLDRSTYLDVILRAHSKKQVVLLDALVPGDGVDVLLRFDGVLDGPVPQSAIHGSDDHHLAIQGGDSLVSRASRERSYKFQAVVVWTKGNVAGRARKGVKIIQCLPIGFSVAADALLEDLDAGVVHAGGYNVAEHGVGPLDLGDQRCVWLEMGLTNPLVVLLLPDLYHSIGGTGGHALSVVVECSIRHKFFMFGLKLLNRLL